MFYKYKNRRRVTKSKVAKVIISRKKKAYSKSIPIVFETYKKKCISSYKNIFLFLIYSFFYEFFKLFNI